MIEILTDLYDCKSKDNQNTITRGSQRLKNIYVTLFGGTTPSGLSSSIPPEAFGDGFMSRLIVVSEKRVQRINPKPFFIPGAPSKAGLTHRFAWIMQNCKGKYEFSPEADRAYEEWYIAFKKSLDEFDGATNGLSRVTTHVPKIALLLRCQRYEKGNIITLDDFLLAKKMVETVRKESKISIETVDVDNDNKYYKRISNQIRKHGTIKRVTLLQNSNIKAYQMNQILDLLLQQEYIQVWSETGIKTSVTKNGKEIYKWVGGSNE